MDWNRPRGPPGWPPPFTYGQPPPQWPQGPQGWNNYGPDYASYQPPFPAQPPLPPEDPPLPDVAPPGCEDQTMVSEDSTKDDAATDAPVAQPPLPDSLPPLPSMPPSGVPNGIRFEIRRPPFNRMPSSLMRQQQQQQQYRPATRLPPPPLPPTIPPTVATAAVGAQGGALEGSQDWPPSLRAYVKRCFAKAVTDVDKDQVEIILKGKITKAASDGSLWSRDWDSEPLPRTLSADVPESPVKSASSIPFSGFGRGRGRGLKSWRDNFAPSTSSRPSSSAQSSYQRRGRRSSSSSSSSSTSSSSSSRDRVRKSRGGKKKGNSGPDYGNNPNCIPLGHGSPAKGLKGRLGQSGGRGLSKRQQKRLNKMKKVGAQPGEVEDEAKQYFYTDPLRMSLDSDMASVEKRQRRAARFAGGASRAPPVPSVPQSFQVDRLGSSNDNEEEFNWESLHIVGTCQDLEKRYLRLTTAPEAHKIRPVPVLVSALEMVKTHWKDKQDYHYACDQMKSIRQDLTVQGVRDEFSVRVYETHARIALEKGDVHEFNQCQSQLKVLYNEIGGHHELEFASYRVLYFMFTNGIADIASTLSELSASDKSDECVSFALQLLDAWRLQNYCKFFRLSREAPKMSGFLVDWMLPRERKQALKAIIKAYRPTVPVDFIQETLAITDSDEWTKFIEPFDLKFSTPERTALDCKASLTSLASLN